MKLPKEIVYYQLSKKYPVRYLCEQGTAKYFDRPVLFDGAAVPTCFTVVIDGDGLEALALEGRSYTDALFVCVGRVSGSHEAPESTVIMVNAAASLPEVLNYLQIIYLMFDAWDEALKTTSYEEGKFTDLIDCSEAIFYNPFSIIDKDFHFIAYSKMSETLGLLKSHDAVGNMTLDLVNDILTSSAYSESCKKEDAYRFTYPVVENEGICKNIFCEGEYVGRFNIQAPLNDEALCRYYCAVVEHLCYYAEKLYKKYRSFISAETIPSSVRNLLSDSLNGNDVTDEQWKKVIREIGWSDHDPLQLVQFRPAPRYDKNTYAKYLGVEIERKWQGCICVEFNAQLLLLVNKAKFMSLERTSFNQSLAYFLRESLLVAGISRQFYEIRHLHSAYTQTETALEYGVRLTPTLWYFVFDNYVLRYMLKNSTGAYEAERICSEKLLALLKHDAEKKTEYFKTLYTYFECRLNSTASAKKLFMQRSSFLYRMERIQELVHINFDSNDELLYLALSFEILRGRETS